MGNLKQILLRGLLFAKQPKIWLLFGVPQILCTYFLASIFRLPANWGIKFFCLAFLILVIQPFVVYLWLKIKADYKKNVFNMPAKNFIALCLKTFWSAIIIALLIFFLKSTGLPWVFVSLVSSLLGSSGLLFVFYVVLLGQAFMAAFALTIDTWKHKISLTLSLALLLIFLHGLSLYFSRNVFDSAFFEGGFSDLSHSATIWLLFIALLFFSGFIAVLINYILVAIFLENIKPIDAKQNINQVRIPKLIES